MRQVNPPGLEALLLQAAHHATAAREIMESTWNGQGALTLPQAEALEQHARQLNCAAVALKLKLRQNEE